MANYREPQWLLPNEKNLQYPAAGATQGSGLTADRHSLYSMDFDGTSLINLDDTNDSFEFTNTPFSVSIWVKGRNNQNRGIICCSSRSSTYGWQIQEDSGNTVSFTAAQGTNARTATSTTLISDTEWLHIVGVFKPGAPANEHVEIWVNGTKEGTNGWTSSPTLSYQATPYKRIAFGYGANTGRRYIGQIDEAAIFSRDLSSSEINTLYNNGSPSNPMLLSGKPLAYYPLGEQARKPGTANWRFPNEVLQGQAMEFDGSTDFIDVDTINLGTTFTVSCWVNFDSFAATKNVIFGGGSSNYALYIPNGTTIWGNFSGSFQAFTVPAISTGSWYNIVLTRNGANGELFINGQSQGTTTSFGSSDFNLNFIGCENQGSGTNYNLDGKLSNAVVWDTDQSANIANIYNYGAPQTSYTVTPTAWYKLDKTSTFTGLNPNWHSALSFNGSGNRVDLSSSIDLGTVNTISLWLRNEVSQDRIFLGEDSYGGDYHILGGYNHFIVRVDASYNVLSTGTVPIIPIASEWSHVVFTRDGDNVSLYINGSFAVSSNTWTNGSPGSTTSKFDAIGAKPTGGTSWLGKISNVAAFDQIISAEDIKYLYNGGTPQTNISFEPLSWYKLDNTGTGIQDLGSASNNGTNNGATEVASNVAVDEWVFENTVQSQTPNWESALSFDGSSVVSTDLNVDATNGMTLSLWLKCGTQSGLVFLCSNGNTGGAISQFNFRIAGGALWSYFNGSPNFNSLLTGLDTNTWNHVVITMNYTTGDVIGYKNTVQGPNTLTYGSSRTTAALRCIGAATSTGTYGVVGEISNVQVWQSVLNTNEIETLYNNGQPQSTAYLSPTSWWKLDNTTTGIQDSGSASNDGTNNGATEIQTNVWTPRLNGESDTLPSTALVSSDLQFNSAYSSFSLDFDGTDYVDCTDNDMFSFGNGTTDSPFSICSWINMDSATNFRILSKYDAPNYEYQFDGGGGTGKLQFYIFDGSNYRGVSYNTALNTGEWYHVVATYNGIGGTNAQNGMKLYVNGLQVNDLTFSSGSYTAMDNTSAKVKIGTIASSYANGKIDETAIFNKTLNQAEITSIYNNGYPKDLTALAPISWWRLGEDAYFNGNDFIIPNQITGAPNGTSNGMPATALVADAPGSYAAGLATGGLALNDRVGDAPNSTANSLSFNMTPENRVSYAAGYTPAQVDNVYSMAFDGNDDYVNVGVISQVNSATACTLCYWGKKTASNKHLLFGSQIGLQNGIWLSWWNDGNVYFSPRNGGNTGAAYALSFDTNWHHFVGVYDGSSAKIYVDGNLVSTNTTSIPTSLSTDAGNDFSIGYLQSTYASGNMDEVAIFDYALSARQIKQDIYNGTTSGKTADLNNNSNLTPPVAWYRMGD